MYKPIIKTKSSDNDYCDDTVITIPELDNNLIETDRCSTTLSILQYYCSGFTAVLGTGELFWGLYVLFSNIYNDTNVEESSIQDINIMGDMPSYLP